MRIMELSVFMFAFLLMVGAINEAHFFNTSMSVDTSVVQINGSAIVEEQNPPSGVLDYAQAVVMGTVNFVTGGLNMLLRVFGVALNLGGYLKACIPFLPDAFCAAVTAMVNVIYVIGVAQFISGRSAKMMD